MTEAADDPGFGRVDADGTVYVRTKDGERVVGQWPDGDPWFTPPSLPRTPPPKKTGVDDSSPTPEILAASSVLFERSIPRKPDSDRSLYQKRNTSELPTSRGRATVAKS